MLGQRENRKLLGESGGQIFLPLLLYVLCSRGIQAAFSFLLPQELYYCHPAAFLGLENLLLFPLFFCIFYCRDSKALPCRTKRKENGENLQFLCRRGKTIILILGASVCLSRGLNLLLTLSRLGQRFPAYERVTGAVYAEPLWVQLLVTVAAAPLMEELLMRGIVYRRMKRQTGNPRLAVVGSAVIFGVFHGNLVQGVYAFFLGLLFAWLLEECQELWAPVLSHGAVNAAALLFNRYSLLSQVPPWQQPAMLSFLTAALLLVGYGFLRWIPGSLRPPS